MQIEFKTSTDEYDTLAFVQSSHEGLFYRVTHQESEEMPWKCTCPSNTKGFRQCKHIIEVQNNL